MNRTLMTTVLCLACGLTGCETVQTDALDTAAAAHDVAPGSRILVNVDRHGVALQGYDPVAYFTDARPVRGSERFTAGYLGATYRFASAEHRDLFRADPTKYAPQFGGYCGYAASIDKLSPISPEYWEIIGGRLVLQHNQRAWDAWHRDVAGNLVKADANWPGLTDRNGVAAGATKRLVNLDESGLAIQGYDPVAYFTDQRPTPGTPEYAAVFNGATYRFASAEHKDAFEHDPARYAPAFGGYCAYAASINKVSPIDSAFWQIQDGLLILQHTKRAYELYNRDAAGNLVKADANWPRLVQRHGK